MSEKNNITYKEKSLRQNFTGHKFGPWKILSYLHHAGTSPIWEAQCVYCKKFWEASLPKIKRKRQCECEERIKWTSGVSIPGVIHRWYKDKAREEHETFDLNLIDLYKIYNRQLGKDSKGEELIFEYHWDYTRNPPTCNYIWPDLEREHKTNGYDLDNCYFEHNDEQRFPRKRGNQIAKAKKLGIL